MRSLCFIVCILSPHVMADIKTDGTVGTAMTLTGPNFEIGSTLGTQSGGNLFHSFSEFSINSGEVANFTGPASVDNIIGRVTGSSSSAINGTIQSSISDANLYLINPNGIIFGKDSRLDIQGSFHATTTNQVSFSDGSTFSASPSSSDFLTIAPLSSFGFLNSSPGKILSESESLEVPTGKNINLIAGDIDISIDRLGRDGIRANNGNINIISTAGNSTVKLVSGTPTLDNQLGGNVNFHGNSRVSTNTNNSTNAGNITIQAQNITLSDKAKINSDTISVGNAGNITIKSHGFMMYGTTDLSTSTYSSGNAGQVTLDIAQGLMTDSSFINSTSYKNSGNAGGININASQSLTLENNATVKSTANSGTTGNGGDVTISTANLSMTGSGDTDGDGDPSEDSALISTNVLANTTGVGGNVTITANTISLLNGATIAVASGGTGKAGDINITTNTKLQADGGFISSRAATASGGNITLRNASDIDLKDSQVTASVASGAGDGGNVFIFDVGGLALQNSNITANSEGASGGKLDLNATVVRDPSSITTALGENVSLDGEVLIASEINPNNALNDLRLDLFVNQIKDPCSVVIAEDESILSIKRSSGSTTNCNK